MKSRSPDFYLTPGESRVTFSAARFRDIPAAPTLAPVPPVALPSPTLEVAVPARPIPSPVPPDPDH